MRSARSTVLRSSVASRGRSGLNIVELLVVFAVIAVLTAIILPAVQSAREAARRTQCINNFKSIGLAIQSFEAAHRHLPNFAPVDGSRDPLDKNFFRNYADIIWRLFPWLDRADIAANELDAFRHYQDLQFPIGDGSPTAFFHIPVLNCPSDVGGPGSNIRFCAGAVPNCFRLYEYNQVGDFTELGAFSIGDRPYQLSDITDGVSNTAAASEKLKGSQSPTTFSAKRDYWYSGLAELIGRYPTAEEVLSTCNLNDSVPSRFFPYASSTWQGRSYSTALYNHVAPPNDIQADCSASTVLRYASDLGSYRASSLHGAIVNVLILDGSVRPVSRSVDLPLWRSLAAMGDGAAKAAE